MSIVDEVKNLIIEGLNLPDISPNDIDSSAPLFNDGLGLDSVDALELGLLIQKKYNIALDSKTMDLKAIFYSVDTLANYISQNKS